jgi:hypothetical protein
MNKKTSVIHWLLSKNYNSISYMNEYIYFQILNIIIIGISKKLKK